jgi:hypothetical protein
MAAFAKPVPMDPENEDNMGDLNSDLVVTAAQYENLTAAMARRCPEIVETVVAEIVDNKTFQFDCATLWAQFFALGVTMAADEEVVNIPEFKRRICAQSQNLFQEPSGLPPARKDGGFWIRTIPGVEPPHRALN